MIVIDSSAFVAILLKEPERDRLMAAIASDDHRIVSALTILETRLVLQGRHGPQAVADFDELIEDISPEIAALDAGQANSAFAAFKVYGKGIHSRARLNMTDCVVYALAKSLNAPLLFKGDDFTATDIVAVANP